MQYTSPRPRQEALSRDPWRWRRTGTQRHSHRSRDIRKSSLCHRCRERPSHGMTDIRRTRWYEDGSHKIRCNALQRPEVPLQPPQRRVRQQPSAYRRYRPQDRSICPGQVTTPHRTGQRRDSRPVRIRHSLHQAIPPPPGRFSDLPPP